jgi:hypothetical protein
MSELVLDRVQLLFRESRNPDTARPRQRPQRIFVDPSGRLRIGDSVPETEGPGLAEVKPDLFA